MKINFFFYSYSKIRSNAVVSDGVQREEQETYQKEQHARVDGSSMVALGQSAVLVGLQAGSVSHDVGNVVLLLDPVEKVRHGAFGKDGNIIDAVGL